MPKDILDSVEADTFWCMTRLLNGIQVFLSYLYGFMPILELVDRDKKQAQGLHMLVLT